MYIGGLFVAIFTFVFVMAVADAMMYIIDTQYVKDYKKMKEDTIKENKLYGWEDLEEN